MPTVVLPTTQLLPIYPKKKNPERLLQKWKEPPVRCRWTEHAFLLIQNTKCKNPAASSGLRWSCTEVEKKLEQTQKKRVKSPKINHSGLKSPKMISHSRPSTRMLHHWGRSLATLCGYKTTKTRRPRWRLSLPSEELAATKWLPSSHRPPSDHWLCVSFIPPLWSQGSFEKTHLKRITAPPLGFPSRQIRRLMKQSLWRCT